MRPEQDAQSWFGPSLLEPGIEQADKPEEFERLWRGFMTARVTLGLVLLLLQSTIYVLGHTQDATLTLICAAYFCATLAVRLFARPRGLGNVLDLQWISTIGIDILAFATLQVTQGSSINYTPLFALPVLVASILGSLLMAMGAAASVTLLLFSYAAWLSLRLPGDTTAHFFQAALTGAGCFSIAFLAHQIASRLANVELRAQRSQLAARVQRLVNELVIESLTDGILVVDTRGMVRAANPAARRLIGPERVLRDNTFDLGAREGWQGLVTLMRSSFAHNTPQQADVTIHHRGQGPRRVQVRTQLTESQEGGTESLCVMFLQDQREMEARMRTEKLASMGRMSAAVAHEIRNPLAAIAQANALLDEDLSDPKQRQLTEMVRQNALRLAKIVDEVLDISRVQHQDLTASARAVNLNEAIERICLDWQAQTSRQPMLGLTRAPNTPLVRFETEHLRRILVNLLDNARRYASRQPDSIQVVAGLSAMGQHYLSVWSDGAPMDQSVERHLFEPFFSSESRSSGLGLYICRELCEGHGAAIAYYRAPRQMGAQTREGNEFLVTFQSMPSSLVSSLTGDNTAQTPWPQTQR
jgi:two-component system sensor histidine kinase PilS (NtrC family)